MSNLKEVSDSDFTEVLKHENVLILFSAPWCGPCNMLTPAIADLADVNTDVFICKMNVDTNPTTTTEYNIRSVPQLVFFKKGTELNRLSGIKPKYLIQKALTELKG